VAAPGEKDAAAGPGVGGLTMDIASRASLLRERPSITTLMRRPMPRTTGGTGMPPVWTRASTGARQARHQRPRAARWRKSCTGSPYEFIAAHPAQIRAC
jgi:hypothetical protein